MRQLSTLVLLLACVAPASSLALTPQWKDVLGAFQSASPQGLGALSDSDIAAGLKAALAQGTRMAVQNLGRTDGFWANAAARIPMPATLQKFEKTARGFGLGAYVDQFQLSMNRAAEQAVPVAADVFAQSIQQMTLTDARNILTGPKDAATQYFRRTTGQILTVKFRPLVAQATARVGVANRYKTLTAAAGPFAGALGAPTDLDGYVTEKALDSLFVQVAAEEARIRDNPAARGSEILKKVFGSRN